MAREWTTVDKPSWGPGPWQNEPDKIQWIDEVTGLDCLMVRQPRLGHWCGYVGVAEGHPAFGQDHANDLVPAMAARERGLGWPPIAHEVYRDRAYVETEVASLARQLARLTQP